MTTLNSNKQRTHSVLNPTRHKGRTVLLVASLAAAGLIPMSHAAAAATSGCTVANHPGFSSAYWTPYDDLAPSQLISALRSQQAIGENTLILDWAADQDASDVAYSGSTLSGYSQFNYSVDNLMAAAQTVGGFRTWMGLVVAPDSFDSRIATYDAQTSELAIFEQVATDTYDKFGDAITGWYVPTEPGWSELSTSAAAAPQVSFLTRLTSWLHTHVGDKPVMISPTMQTAATYGHSAYDFVYDLGSEGVFANSGIDIWNLQDGYGQNGWTPASETSAYQLAESDVAAVNTPNAPADYPHPTIAGTIWTPKYNQASPPVAQPPANFEPFLQAIGASSTGAGVQISEWTFADYMNPDATATNNSAADYSAYSTYCKG